MKSVILVDDMGYVIHPETVADDAELTDCQIDIPCPDGFNVQRWDFYLRQWVAGDDLPVVEPDARPQAPTAGEQLRADLDYVAMMTGIDL